MDSANLKLVTENVSQYFKTNLSKEEKDMKKRDGVVRQELLSEKKNKERVTKLSPTGSKLWRVASRARESSGPCLLLDCAWFVH